MSVRTNILNMSKIYDRTISQSAIMLFMNHQGPLEAPSMVACFHHKIPTGFMMLLDYDIGTTVVEIQIATVGSESTAMN